MVYETLNLLSEQKKKITSSVDAEGNDKDINFPSDDEEFLPLDDIIEEGKNINLKEDLHKYEEQYSNTVCYIKKHIFFLFILF